MLIDTIFVVSVHKCVIQLLLTAAYDTLFENELVEVQSCKFGKLSYHVELYAFNNYCYRLDIVCISLPLLLLHHF